MKSSHIRHTAARICGHLPPFKGKMRILRTLSHPDKQEKNFINEKIWFPRFKFWMNIDSRRYSDWTLYMLGTLQPHETRQTITILKRLKREYGDFEALDVGANVGFYTLLYSTYAAKTHAFEPNPEILEILRENVETNENNSIVISDSALSDRNGTVDFFTPINSANMGVASLSEKSVSEHRKITVKTQKLDDYYESTKSSKPVKFIKIDVEGFEYFVLQGGKRLLREHKPTLMLEVNVERYKNAGATYKKLHELLVDLGYSIYTIDLKPIETVENLPQSGDIFCSTTSLSN